MDYSRQTDEQIALYTRTENQEAYQEIINRYQEKLLRYVGSLTKDKMAGADIVQSTFIKAFVNLNNFDTKKKFSAWIYRIAHNETMGFFSKHKKEIPMLESIDFKSKDDIEETLSIKETKQKVNQCLAQMPPKYSEPLFLFFIEEKSYEEISDIMRLPVGTVGTRINRAKILMKKICQKQKTK